MQWWPVGVAFLAAMSLPVQAACVTALNRVLGQPLLAILISMAGSVVTVVAITLASGRLITWQPDRVALVPWWAWAAGLGGALYVGCQPFVVPKLGAALFVSLAVTGQVTAAMALDHFGALGLPTHPASPLRLLGAGLIAGGMVLVSRF